MGATESHHALKFGASGLAPSGVVGIWLLAGMLAAGSVRADDESAQPAAPPPVPVRIPATAPAPAARKSYGPYIFFQPGGRTTYRPPAVEPGKVALVPPPARPAYLYFTPGKRPTTPAAPGPIARPIVPDPAPPPRTRPPAANEEVAVDIPPPRPVKHPSLIFFTPKRDPKANDRALPDGLPPLPPLPGGTKPNERAAAEKIPVRVPAPAGRKPQPYLIFQPKRAKVRPNAPPVEKGSSPSATSELSPPDRIAATGTPRSARPASPRGGSVTPAAPTYRVVLDTQVEPATIPALSFPEFDSEARTRPNASIARASEGLARASGQAELPRAAERPAADAEPIRLTGATRETYDAIGPPIPAGLPPLVGGRGATGQPAQ